jgi:hypothetical protein
VSEIPKEVSFENLTSASLRVDAVYKGGSMGTVADEPITKLLRVGNSGGIRTAGPVSAPRAVVLFSTFGHPDWPDQLDLGTGTITYYGDNKTPGRDLHDTHLNGNLVLRNLFQFVSEGSRGRERVCPIFFFSKEGVGRDVKFRGVAVPGSVSSGLGEDLVAIWRSQGDSRFQNYRATFTILDIAEASRLWINDILGGVQNSNHAPEAWRDWVSSGIIRPLISQSLEVRNKAQQLPVDALGRNIVGLIHHYFNSEIQNPFMFEICAVDIWKMTEPSIGEVDLTRPWKDGGRDAIGTYLLGSGADPLRVDFALEAKCYGIENSVGVRDVSRLISRLRYRQFGVFITTSYFNRQAYQEIREDQHPVVLIPAREIVDTLARHGISNEERVEEWLRQQYADRN